MKKAVQITVEGKVQGVYFRQSTKTKADVLDISGIVKNLPNGNVYIEAEGEENNLQEFMIWCYTGPSNANVISVDIKEIAVQNFMDFQIVR